MKNKYFLSIESSGECSSVCIGDLDSIIAVNSIYIKHSQDKFLATQIRNILDLCKLDIDNLSAVFISEGPGSFTGLRVGASIAKAICFTNKPKLIGVSTIDSVAFNFFNFFPKKHSINILIHSHSNYFYVKKFKNLNSYKESVDLIKIENQDIFNNKLYIGPGIKNIRKIKIDDKYSYFSTLKAEFIHNLGVKLWQEEKFTLSEEFIPKYYQDFKTSNKKN